MSQHQQEMEGMFRSTVLLRYAEVEATASAISRTPPLPNPAVTLFRDPEVGVPREFFALQDELRVRAGELVKAAHDHDNSAMAKGYGRMTETCVSCHALLIDAVHERSKR
jgi:hypothetical protein